MIAADGLLLSAANESDRALQLGLRSCHHVGMRDHGDDRSRRQPFQIGVQ